jgi:hypothetical protein
LFGDWLESRGTVQRAQYALAEHQIRGVA